MRFPTQRQKPRRSQVTSFPAPTGGWVSNRNLAVPGGGGAAVLENFFPTAQGVLLRRGMRRWASIVQDSPVKSLFTYSIGAQSKLFAATDQAIWDVSIVPSPYAWVLATEDNDYIAADPGAELVFGENPLSGAAVYTAVTNGDWSVLQFSTPGGTFLVGVNGVDTGFIYDGTTFWPYIDGGIWSLSYSAASGPFEIGETITGGTSSETAVIHSIDTANSILYLRDRSGPFTLAETITGGTSTETATAGAEASVVPGLTGIASSELSHVWAYQERVFFVESDSLNAWYLSVDTIGGTATKLPLGGVFNRGGSLLFGQAWSLSAGNSGGLSDQCIFCTTEGEIAAYQGLGPGDASWGKVGLYRVGKPLGRKAIIRAGGDLVIATSVGFISLAAASQSDYAALGRGALSYPIEDDWARALIERGTENWRCQVWADGQMVIVAPPRPVGKQPILFVANTNTGAWAKFTAWDVTSMEVFGGRLMFGSSGGEVRQGMIGGSDEGAPYAGAVIPLYGDLGAPASLKIADLGRAVVRTAYNAKTKLTAKFNFSAETPAPPSAATEIPGNVWDNATWDVSVWDAERSAIVIGGWVSLGGSGHDVSMCFQVSSGAVAPIDMELVRLDMTYTTAEVVT